MDSAASVPDYLPVTESPTVLLVDDATCFRGVARSLLERRGYRVVAEADTAATALVSYQVVRPEAALIDLELPDANGFDLAARLVSIDPRLAVLLTSARFDQGFYALAVASGARGFVPKSVLAHTELQNFWPPATSVAEQRLNA
jgi:two-component system, NarL family, response regulator DesR